MACTIHAAPQALCPPARGVTPSPQWHVITIDHYLCFRYTVPMRTTNSYIISRTDYRPYPYTVSQVRLYFDLDHDITRVTAELDMQRCGDEAAPLVLDGDALTLVSEIGRAHV